MSKQPGYDLNDALVINHAQLRAPVDLQTECQQQLLALDSLSQDTGEYLFLRELKLKSSVNALGTNFKIKLVQQRDLAVDGDSIDAENAQAVRFRSLGQLLAQLSLHIQAGRKKIWYWQSWQYLFEMPTGDALALLWSDYATDLADMIQALADNNQLQSFWLSLGKAQCAVILSSVKRALGVDTDGSLHEKELNAENYNINISMNALLPWKCFAGQFDCHDERLQLASLVILLRWRPDQLFNNNLHNNINSVSKQLRGEFFYQNNAAQESIIVNERNDNAVVDDLNSKNSDSVNKEKNISKNNESDLWAIAKSKKDRQYKTIEDVDNMERVHITEPEPELYDSTNEQFLSDLETNNRLSTENEKPNLFDNNVVENDDDLANPVNNWHATDAIDQAKRDTDAISDEILMHDYPQTYADRGSPFCQQGGVFYLLNFMALNNTQSLLQQHNAYETLMGPWGCLYRLTDLLNRKEDESLDQFFCYRMGLDSIDALKQLPPLMHAEQYEIYAEKLYGPLVWNSKLLSIPAQIEYTSSHLDIHFPLSRVDLNVRRVALDINPGWLPWLGQVVNFHYHADMHIEGVEH